MKQHFLGIFPTEFHTNAAFWRGFSLAIVFLVLLVTQLYSYEDFGAVVEGYGLPGGMAMVVLVAALIPLFEVLSLPFLLSMKVSRQWRRISRFAVVAAPVLWLLIALATNLLGTEVLNSGVFGATLPVVGGWWLVAFAGLLLWSALLVVQELPERT